MGMPGVKIGTRRVKSHVEDDTCSRHQWLQADEAGNDRADKAATAAMEASRKGAGCVYLKSKYIKLLQTSLNIQLTNVTVMNARWGEVREAKVEPGEYMEPSGRRGIKLLRQTDVPSTEHIEDAKKVTFKWDIPILFMAPHKLGKVKSGAISADGWNFHYDNRTAMVSYFDGLKWSRTETPVLILELFVDSYAYTKCKPRNRREHRVGRLKAKDVVSSFNAMIRGMGTQIQPDKKLHPAPRHDTLSHQTKYGLMKQAVGLLKRPDFRCPEAVDRFMAWVKWQEIPLDK